MVPRQCVEWQSPYDTRAAFYKQIIIKASVLGENSNLGLDAVQLQAIGHSRKNGTQNLESLT